MNKKIIYGIFLIIFLFTIASCTVKKEINDNQNSKISTANENKNKEDMKGESEVPSFVKIFINNNEYIMDLEDNETTRVFTNLLPLEFNMNELNGNEKYIYLDNTLPTNSYNPKHINAGDVMLYGNNCLVIFYKSFDTEYSYTKIGHINKLPNLESDELKVKFENK